MKSSDFSGRVLVALRCNDGRVADVSVSIARPTAADAMRGRPAGEVQRTLPMLYSICGAAQGAAARLAIAAAQGSEAPPYVDAGVKAEALREHLWRLLLDWPVSMGLPREEGLLAEALRRLRCGDFDAWCDGALKEPLDRLAGALDTVNDVPLRVCLLPPMTAAQTALSWQRLDEAFAAAPHYGGEPAETGALARGNATDGAGWTDRVRSRIAEVLRPSEREALGRVSAIPLAAGTGRAVVETARGVLMHEVTLEAGRVTRYVVVAPTEWNFHPRGALATALQGLATPPDALRTAVERRLLAFDACVPCDLRMEST